VAKRISESTANNLHSWIFAEVLYDWWRHEILYRYQGIFETVYYRLVSQFLIPRIRNGNHGIKLHYNHYYPIVSAQLCFWAQKGACTHAKPLTHDPSRRPVVTGRHDRRYFWQPTWRPSRERPSWRLSRRAVVTGRRDGSCVRGFTEAARLKLIFSQTLPAA